MGEGVTILCRPTVCESSPFFFERAPMTRRETVLAALNHRQPARVPRDFGGTGVSGIHCSLVEELRRHFGLEKRLVKVPEPSAFLGWIDADLAEALGVDIAMAMGISSVYGVSVRDWREWRTPWGQEVLIPAGFVFSTSGDGAALAHPKGDLSAPPSGKMPASSFFIDVIIRQEGEIDDDRLDPKDNVEEFGLLDDASIQAIVANCAAARATGRAVTLQAPGASLGDIARIPGPALKSPKGVRDIEEWYVSISLRPDYVRRVLEMQAEIALENLRRLHAAGGDDLCDVLHLCGTDFGTQTGTFCSTETFEALWGASYRKLCGWVHESTPWKTFKHSCGSVVDFVEHFIDVGFDILNPVQCSAARMEAAVLKKSFGDRIVFWGGGVDTQKTLPFGTPEGVRLEVLERCRIFSPGGGFVFSPIHNTQAKTPLANFLAMLDALNEFDAAGR